VYDIADCRDKVTSYDLVAVICHHGTAGGMTLALLHTELNVSFYLGLAGFSLIFSF